MGCRINEKGFTLIEVVMASMLFLLILIPMYGLLDFGVQSFRRLEQGVDQQQNLRIAMENISQDLRNSRGVVSRASTVRADEYNLLLKTREGDIIWYYLSGETLRWAKMQKGTTTFHGHNPVADRIMGLNFFYNKLPVEESTQVKVLIQGPNGLDNFEYHTAIFLNLD